MKLQSFLKILLLSNIALGQVTLSKEEVRNIANKIDSLQTLDSLNSSIILDYKDKVSLNFSIEKNAQFGLVPRMYKTCSQHCEISTLPIHLFFSLVGWF